MKKIQLLLTTALLSVSTLASSHPGNTASDGCHYCRTNCSSWGVPSNARHCHGGYKQPEAPLISPIVKTGNAEPKAQVRKDAILEGVKETTNKTDI